MKKKLKKNLEQEKPSTTLSFKLLYFDQKKIF
jgi:hypothetical protein